MTSATADRPIPHAQAWPLEARQMDCIAQLDRAVAECRLALFKPGYLAGTFGLAKEWVREEMKKRSELAGSGK